MERVTGLHEGDVLGKTKARRESETVAVALSFLDTNRGLLGSGTTQSSLTCAGIYHSVC